MRSTMTRQMVPTRGAPAGAAAATRAGAGGGAAGRAAAARTSAVEDGAAGSGAAQRARRPSRARRPAGAPSGTPAARRGAGPLPGGPASRRSDEGEDVRLLDRAVRSPSPGRGRRRAARRPSGPGATPSAAAAGGDRRHHRGGRRGPRADRSRWRGGLDGSGLVGAEDERDRLADGDHVACLRGHVAQDAGGRRLDLDGGLVGLDLDERLALPDRVAGRLEPAAGPCRCPAPARAPA